MAHPTENDRFDLTAPPFRCKFTHRYTCSGILARCLRRRGERMKQSKAETRTQILDAAYGLFWRQGFLRVSMDEIAARADVTKRTLYQHFRSKDDLIAAALAQSSELALERLRGCHR